MGEGISTIFNTITKEVGDGVRLRFVFYHIATYIQWEKNQSYTMRVVSPSIQTSRHVSIHTQKVSFGYLLVFGHLVISTLINPWISETLLNTQPCQSRQPKASAAVRSSNI